MYAKSILAVLATVATALVAAFTDDYVSTVEWINVAVAGVTACAVFAAPNVPGARYTKAVIAVLGAVLTALVGMVTDGISSEDLAQLVVIALGAVGVYAVPNKGSDGSVVVDSSLPDEGAGEAREIFIIAAGIICAGLFFWVLAALFSANIHV